MIFSRFDGEGLLAPRAPDFRAGLMKPMSRVRRGWIVSAVFLLAFLAVNRHAFAALRHDRATEKLLYSANNLTYRFTPQSGKAQVEKAIVLYQSVIRSSAAPRYKVEAYWGEGQAYEKTGQRNAALGTYQTLFKRYPGSGSAPASLYEIGKLQLASEKPRDALKVLE
jgi:tetratricopeptide (TPR) repeat protein